MTSRLYTACTPVDSSTSSYQRWKHRTHLFYWYEHTPGAPTHRSTSRWSTSTQHCCDYCCSTQPLKKACTRRKQIKERPAASTKHVLPNNYPKATTIGNLGLVALGTKLSKIKGKHDRRLNLLNVTGRGQPPATKIQHPKKSPQNSCPNMNVKRLQVDAHFTVQIRPLYVVDGFKATTKSIRVCRARRRPWRPPLAPSLRKT